jgi:dipeptidase E
MNKFKKRNMLLMSDPKLLGNNNLKNYIDDIRDLLGDSNELLFIANARPGGILSETYFANVKSEFKAVDIDVKGFDDYKTPSNAISKAKAIFVGGGNTSFLANFLQRDGLMNWLGYAIKDGVPFMTEGAGSVMVGQSVHFAKDRWANIPLDSYGLSVVPFDISPNYDISNYESENRSIEEVLKLSKQAANFVVAIPNGVSLRIKGDKMHSIGNKGVHVFGKVLEVPLTYSSKEDLSKLLNL